MTQQKSKSQDFAAKFRALDAKSQAAVTHFFNLHNAAIFIYATLSKEAAEYAEYCMNLSMEASSTEAKIND